MSKDAFSNPFLSVERFRPSFLIAISPCRKALLHYRRRTMKFNHLLLYCYPLFLSSTFAGRILNGKKRVKKGIKGRSEDGQTHRCEQSLSSGFVSLFSVAEPLKFSKKSQISNLIRIRLVGAELLHADGRTDILKVTVAFREFANAPKNLKQFSVLL